LGWGPVRRTPLVLLAAVGLGSQGCQGEGHAAPRPDPARADVSLRGALRSYANIAHAAYGDAAAGARKLGEAVASLTASPSASTVAEARKAWIDARRPYAQTEHLRFYGGPIDATELLINTWPIDESYLEAPAGMPPTGIIDDVGRYPELSVRLLSGLNTKGGETSISTGYHPVEFLLWGRDTRFDGPGDRPHTDFDPGSSPLAIRRTRYLALAVELLVTELETLRDDWAPDRPGNYRSRFLGMPVREALGLAIKGMGSLSGPELGGERLTVAYETKDQENEHSCFSDTTHEDLVGNARGIHSACTGRYVRAEGSVVSGPGLCDAIAAVDPKLGARLRAETAASVEALGRIPAPFDRAIQGADDAPGRLAVEHAIAALALQTKSLTEVAAAFDLRASFAVVPATMRSSKGAARP
jgi:putative iron-regulated protein